MTRFKIGHEPRTMLAMTDSGLLRILTKTLSATGLWKATLKDKTFLIIFGGHKKNSSSKKKRYGVKRIIKNIL